MEAGLVNGDLCPVVTRPHYHTARDGSASALAPISHHHEDPS